MDEENLKVIKIVENKDKWDLKEFLKFLILTAVIVLPIRFYIAQPYMVSGASMLPTFEDGQYLIVDQLSYKFNQPERGDVIVFRYPKDPKKFFIKRLIGVPGDTVQLVGHEVYITPADGKEKIKLSEPYLDEKLERDANETLKLEDHQYYVMGDNRLQSYDSRFWGPVDENFIIGKVFLRLYPFNEIGYKPGKANY